MPLKLPPVKWFADPLPVLRPDRPHPVASAQSDLWTGNSLLLQPGCVSEGLEPYWSKRSNMSRPFPPVHHGTACWSQKSLTTTNISAATACLSLISCWGDIFRVSQPLWRGRRAEPTPHQPPNKLQSNMLCSFSLILAVSCSWLLMVSLTPCCCYIQAASYK